MDTLGILATSFALNEMELSLVLFCYKLLSLDSLNMSFRRFLISVVVDLGGLRDLSGLLSWRFQTRDRAVLSFFVHGTYKIVVFNSF